MDLTEARENAKEKMKGFCGIYKVCDGLPERLCQGIKYGKAIGMGGIGKGLSFAANVEALDRIKLRTRLITPHVEPDTKASFVGREVAFPIFCTSMSGVKISMGGGLSELDFARALIQGAQQGGSLSFIGDGPKPSKTGRVSRPSGKWEDGGSRSSSPGSKKCSCA
jgi:4-hydroxymandelate oxidase